MPWWRHPVIQLIRSDFTTKCFVVAAPDRVRNARPFRSFQAGAP
ncbi:hypothetical protein DM2_1537 [Halorubrum sp. DM2]|nr:hypothetical protein DM2_1537 [Halorubrum sp. DM2]